MIWMICVKDSPYPEAKYGFNLWDLDPEMQGPGSRKHTRDLNEHSNFENGPFEDVHSLKEKQFAPPKKMVETPCSVHLQTSRGKKNLFSGAKC